MNQFPIPQVGQCGKKRTKHVHT